MQYFIAKLDGSRKRLPSFRLSATASEHPKMRWLFRSRIDASLMPGMKTTSLLARRCFCRDRWGTLCAHELGPDRLPVIGAKVTACEFTATLSLYASAVGDRDACAPTVHRLAGKIESACKSCLKAGSIKERLPVVHGASMVEPDSRCQARPYQPFVM